MLKSSLLWKIVTLGGVMILLLIPLMMIRYQRAVAGAWRRDVPDASSGLVFALLFAT
ncbi:membrane protein [Salmonella enterica]|uniref:Membrane protein n=1 Tax=Salmonella enterica TaxID=28901 RepID=A0A379QNY6_SALER|nr:membrane protein [Salmonella enterica]